MESFKQVVGSEGGFKLGSAGRVRQNRKQDPGSGQVASVGLIAGH